MKTTLALALTALVSASSAFAGLVFSNTMDIDMAHSNIRISDVRYWEVATRTEVRQIPGCNPNGEISQVCTQEVVLEKEPAVRVEVSYAQGTFHDPETREGWFHLYLDPASFNPADIEELKAASVGAVWDLSGRKFRARRAWGQQHLSLQTNVATRTITVDDARNSRYCNIGESGEPAPGCVEVRRYKQSTKKVREVTVLVK